MPTIIMTKWPMKLDGDVRSKAMNFLQKLAADDALPGLHVEPIAQSADSRVRTGRVDQFWRAVMFRLDSRGEVHYVVHGVWPHDDAIQVARRACLTVNPINGMPEIATAPEVTGNEPSRGTTSGRSRQEQTPIADEPSSAVAAPGEPPLAAAAPGEPLLVRLGRTRSDLTDRLGISDGVADSAMAATDDDAILELAGRHEGWLGLVLLGLGSGDSVQSIIDQLELERPSSSTVNDEDIINSLQRPAAQAQFAFIDDQDELRRVIELGDFGAWRVFLHPEQRRYVDKSWGGPFRLSGGAGTGKTVVLVHRACRLARQDPDARIVLTTFTTNLADSLRDGIKELDPAVSASASLSEPGIYATGIDALASAVVRSAGTSIGDAVEAVLGEPRSEVNGRTANARWLAIVADSASSLSPEIANETFLAAEYALVVLPNRIRTEEEYLRVRRPGRGVALDRGKRASVWALFAAYRAQSRVAGTLDYAEAAAVAACHLQSEPNKKPADHVLVDEGQDLSPTHWQLLRALVPEGPDDLFIAEDSHQRIYGARTVLGRYGIRIVGRSQRLRLNYRTTAQNLRYGMSILEGAEYVDLENGAEGTGYRSARSGPAPVVEPPGSLETELHAIASHTKAWIDAGTKPETIAVLVQDRFQRDRITNRLSEQGIPARAVDRDRPPAGRILVMTMHRAKGMEFSKVILTDVGYRRPGEQARLDAMDESERLDAELRARSLQYVAATRARDELVVLQRT